MGVGARASGAARMRVLAGRVRERRARGADMVGVRGIGVEWRGSWEADWGRCGRTAVGGELGLGVAVAVDWSCDELR